MSTLADAAQTKSGAPDLYEIERFFVEEAALLDEWRLDEWLTLMDEDGAYFVPSMDNPDADPKWAIFLISDDIRNLRSRISQFRAKSVWSENPRSRTRRLVSNFRIIETDGGVTTATANFAVWRFQFEQTDAYVGRYKYKFVRTPAGDLKIKERWAILDHEALRPHGKLSIIL